jgi:methyl-accepting chemotaxis protein
MQTAIKENEEKILNKENEARTLFERMVATSKKFREQSSKVAAGDFRERLVIGENDVMQELGLDLNTMTDSLANITKKISDASSVIIQMVDKVKNSANEELQSITSEASAINEISAPLEEIDKSSKQTMNKAQNLREAARTTLEQGKLGASLVNESIGGIKDSEEKVKTIEQTILNLSNHTQQIGEITKVVNALAQQLKMLALNAAIEASKAGEAGRGFAAVATEVRNLAEQSEQSTDQVQNILEDIRLTTEKAVVETGEGTKTLIKGTQKIEKTGEVIEKLSKMIEEATLSSQQIEAAIRQEAVGIEQIVESMTEINKATTTLASGVNDKNAFIHELAEIAKQLKSEVDVYKI